MVKRKGQDISDVSKISKAPPIIKWTEYFAGFIHPTVCEINISLSYVIHESDTLPGVAPQIMKGKSYSEDNGYVEKELIMR